MCIFALANGNNMRELFRNCDLDTVVNFLGKENICKMKTSHKTVERGLMYQCDTTLVCFYEGECSLLLFYYFLFHSMEKFSWQFTI